MGGAPRQESATATLASSIAPGDDNQLELAIELVQNVLGGFLVDDEYVVDPSVYFVALEVSALPAHLAAEVAAIWAQQDVKRQQPAVGVES